MPKLNVQQNNANVIKALRNALAIGQIKGPIASDGNDNFTSTGSNRNLLDNAYFVGGGSQLGEGKFPINQRGQTQYTAAGFVFDRWFKSGGVTATLDAGGLTIVNSNGWPDGINQRFPMHFFAQMNGEAITASVLYADGSVDSGTAIIDATQNYQWLKYPEAGEIGFQLKNFQDGAAYDYFDYISFGAGTNSTPKKIKAVKLELGTVSTLANDAPPDFGEELRKCQRRLFIHDFASGEIIADGFAVSASYSVCSLVLPVSMASDGTLTGTVTVNPLIYGGGTSEQVSSFSVSAVKGNYAKIGVATTVMPPNTSVTLYANTNIRLTISKEL